MIKNYLLIAKRVLFNKFVFTILNISGLAIGIAAGALIFHYIAFERSFDSYFKRIFIPNYNSISSFNSYFNLGN